MCQDSRGQLLDVIWYNIVAPLNDGIGGAGAVKGKGATRADAKL